MLTITRYHGEILRGIVCVYYTTPIETPVGPQVYEGSVVLTEGADGELSGAWSDTDLCAAVSLKLFPEGNRAEVEMGAVFVPMYMRDPIATIDP